MSSTQPHPPQRNPWLLRSVLITAGVLLAVGLTWMVRGLLEGAPPEDNLSREELAGQALAILRKHCHECHGDNKQERGLDVLNRDSLVEQRKRPRLVPGDLDSSALWLHIQQDTMPPSEEGKKPLSAAEKAIIKRWISAEAPFPANASPNQRFRSQHEVLTAVRTHLQQLQPTDRPHQRYFTLTHLANNPGVELVVLRVHRAAFSKLVNSLTWQAKVIVPQAIDPEQTLFSLDLRQFGWHRPGVWEQVERAYPYGLSHEQSSDEALRRLAGEVRELSGTALFSLRLDWFIVWAAQPPLYQSLLDLPQTAQELETKLGVDFGKNFRAGELARGGVTHSGVSTQNRLIERHATAHGAYWKSYEFRKNEDRGNLLQYPLGPRFQGNPHLDFAFEHGANEMLFNLPNGLQGYFLTDERGQRTDSVSLELGRDRTQTVGSLKIVLGLSCMSCHMDGVLRVQDVVRASKSVPPQAQTTVEKLYPTQVEMQRWFNEDEDRFQQAGSAAMRPFLADRTTQGEPIGAVARRYLQRDLGLDEVAGELGVDSQRKLQELIRGNNRLREKLGLGPLLQGERIKRAAWTAAGKSVSLMQQAVAELQLGEPVRP